jgi:hemerythrin-like domain-containing protein
MLRDPALIPLSRQHQHALALCVRIDRSLKAGIAEVDVWQPEIEEQFQQEIRYHFDAEESVLFPIAERTEDLIELTSELRADHVELRRYFALAAARTMSIVDLHEFSETLTRHIRREERELFERLQRILPPEELVELGVQLDAAILNATHSCALPKQKR